MNHSRCYRLAHHSNSCTAVSRAKHDANSIPESMIALPPYHKVDLAVSPYLSQLHDSLLLARTTPIIGGNDIMGIPTG